MSANFALKRSLKEYKDYIDIIKKNNDSDCKIYPANDSNGNDNFLEYNCVVKGSEGSPYVSGYFIVNIKLSKDYPRLKPFVKFITKIYHPNISTYGDVCISILTDIDGWLPSYGIINILESIRSIFGDPNPSSALNHNAATKYTSNKLEYNKIVREHIKLYAYNEDTIWEYINKIS